MATALPIFTPAQAREPVWRLIIKPALIARLEEYRYELERQTNTDASTASLRGKCQMLREILALETDPDKARRFNAAMHHDERSSTD
jgi:hypothetical protein